MKTGNRKKEIIAFIQNFQTKEGFGPTVREMCQALGLASPGSLMKHLRALEQDGHLSRTPGKKRTWKLTAGPAGPSIPLLGRIAAGMPLLAQENREADLPVDPGLFGCDETFALRIKGDSMIEAHIQDGDLAIIRPQEEAEDGRIVAVLIDGPEPEATLKVIRRSKDRIELHPANQAFEAMVFKGRDRARIRILGRLVGVIRAGA